MIAAIRELVRAWLHRCPEWAGHNPGFGAHQLDGLSTRVLVQDGIRCRLERGHQPPHRNGATTWT